MSDALCGPSNALQNFQKHASVDRTLQQDRLTSRQPPVQGFRSQSAHDGILDPEFAAFEANLGGPALPDPQPLAQFGAPAQPSGAAHVASSWASDFQNLHISGPPAPQLQRPHMASARNGWRNEFFSQQQQRAPMQHAEIHQSAANNGFQPAFAPSHLMSNVSMGTHQPPLEMRSENPAPMEQFDESAFEAAFEQARADLELQRAEASVEAEQPLPETNHIQPAESVHETIRIGSDLIPETDKQDTQAWGRDADALAQTAGQLLNNVQHDQSDKFQQSNFLALMRRIRDREVEVEGDEFREVSSNP
ncbi:uncharacterized protein N7459_009825 [Penicillium hispanicum]|uniref:uncharacterized protein n=1 Tax=Penicillium hispanicum TaxID=1080232 RepID=UPI002541FFF3|nr:uncharacterized protein N7459_009825 [Penicillium hispanicum]KAJ5570395.1 hypothetical protein N7459_009825 [Penicillium hispanicum]